MRSLELPTLVLGSRFHRLGLVLRGRLWEVSWLLGFEVRGLFGARVGCVGGDKAVVVRELVLG